jgi:PAS domain S-box-containing protein
MRRDKTGPSTPGAWSSDRRLQAIIDNTTAVIYVKDVAGRYLLINRQYEKLFHVTRDEIRGRTDYDIFPSDFAEAFCANDRQVFVSQNPIEFEEVVPHDDGVHTYISIKFPLYDTAGVVEAVCGISTDITERQRAQEELRRLAQHLATVREDERQRLGLDLHDGVCQELAGIALMVESARVHLEPAAAERVPELARAGEHLLRVMEHLRTLGRDLLPVMVRDLGLEQSLRTFVSGLTSGETKVTATLPLGLPRLGEQTEIGLYRIAQEALTNAIRHARAHNVALELTVDGKLVRLVVRDDGRGFRPGAATAKGLGIGSMKQRALALGGKLDVRSEPGSGTTVSVECLLAAPLSAAS